MRARFTKELKKMAGRCWRYRWQTNLFALNCGNRGRARRRGGRLCRRWDAVRKASAQSADTGKRIGDKVETVNGDRCDR